jgi:hypothetical protein
VEGLEEVMVGLAGTGPVVIAVLGAVDLGDTADLTLVTSVADKVDLGVKDLVDAVDLADIMALGVVDFLDKVDLTLGILVHIIVDITVLVGADLVDTMGLIILDLTLDILVGIAVLVGTDLMDITAVTLITGVFTTDTMKSLKRRKTFFLPLAFSLDLVLGV